MLARCVLNVEHRKRIHAHPPPPTSLVRPGWRSNNDVSRMQAKTLGFKRQFPSGVVYLQGPVASDGPADKATAEFFDGPFFSWFEPKDTEHRADQLLLSLHSAVTFVRANGPFTAVYGGC